MSNRKKPAMPAKKNRLSFADLSKKVDQPEPFEVEVAPDVVLTFHDPYGGSYDEELEMPDRPREQLRVLLGDDGFAAFEKTEVELDSRTYVALVQSVMEHFRLGEDNASQR